MKKTQIAVVYLGACDSFFSTTRRNPETQFKCKGTIKILMKSGDTQRAAWDKVAKAAKKILPNHEMIMLSRAHDFSRRRPPNRPTITRTLRYNDYSTFRQFDNNSKFNSTMQHTTVHILARFHCRKPLDVNVLFGKKKNVLSFKVHRSATIADLTDLARKDPKIAKKSLRSGKVYAIREVPGGNRIYPATRINDLDEKTLESGLRIIMETRKPAPKPFASWMENSRFDESDEYDVVEARFFDKSVSRKSFALRGRSERKRIEKVKLKRKAARLEAWEAARDAQAAT